MTLTEPMMTEFTNAWMVLLELNELNLYESNDVL